VPKGGALDYMRSQQPPSLLDQAKALINGGGAA
jgi:hypothetical protein